MLYGCYALILRIFLNRTLNQRYSLAGSDEAVKSIHLFMTLELLMEGRHRLYSTVQDTFPYDNINTLAWDGSIRFFNRVSGAASTGPSYGRSLPIMIKKKC
jgi:hypothetical protein